MFKSALLGTFLVTGMGGAGVALVQQRLDPPVVYKECDDCLVGQQDTVVLNIRWIT